MPVIAHDLVDRPCANFVADSAQLSAVGKNGIFKGGHFVEVPLTVSIASFGGLPLVQRNTKVREVARGKNIDPHLFGAKDIGHGYIREVPTESVCLGETPNGLSEPVDVGTQALLRS